MGIRSKIQEAMKIYHFEEAICLGLMSRPIKNKIIPIIQAMICLPKESGAIELTIKIFMENKKIRLIKTVNQGVLDITNFS